MNRQGIFEIGDAVIPRDAKDHDVMTVYDMSNGFKTAHCNWVVGTRMFKATYPVSNLWQVQRRVRRTQ